MRSWVLIDTETDGLYPPISIVEVAAQKFEGLEPVGEPFQIFINHGTPIDPAATEVHGYTMEFIATNGVAPREAYSRLRNYVRNNHVASHYLRFDWDRVLVPELNRLGESPIGLRGFCTWQLAQRSLPELPTHKLDFLRDHYKIDCSRPQSASGDVESTSNLLTQVIFPRLKAIGIDSVEHVAEFSGLRPVVFCKLLLDGLSYDEARRKLFALQKENRLLRKHLNEVGVRCRSIASVILEHELIEEDATVTFEGKTFLFTGKMSWGNRTQATEQIEKRGGNVSKAKSLADAVDYLILGEDLLQGWTNLHHGRKLMDALFRRVERPKSKFKIIREEHFRAALETTLNPVAHAADLHSFQKSDSCGA